MAEVFDWNILAASNNNPPPNGWPENMEYDEVNDTGREVMAVIARFIAGINGTKTTGGTSTAYTLTSGYTLSGYAAGQMFAFVANADSTGSVTLNVNGLGAGNVVDSRGVQLGAGDIRNGGYYLVRRTSGGTFMVLGHLSSSSIASAAGVTLTSAYSAGGTGNAITITPSPAFTAYANGQLIAFIATANNTGAVTINISGLGAEALEDYRSAALSADDIVSGRWYIAGRVGGEWRILAGLPIDVANDVVGLLAIANGGTGASTAANAFAALKQAASTTATGVVELATDAEVRSSASGASGTVVSASQIESASAAVALTDAATVSVDWDTGINFTVTLGGNRTLGNATNGQPGTWRTIQITQDGTGSRTLAYGNQYVFPGGTEPVLTTAASAIDRLSIYCRSSTVFEVYATGMDLKQ